MQRDWGVIRYRNAITGLQRDRIQQQLPLKHLQPEAPPRQQRQLRMVTRSELNQL